MIFNGIAHKSPNNPRCENMWNKNTQNLCKCPQNEQNPEMCGGVNY